MSREYFRGSEWMWAPIPANPVLDDSSDAIVDVLETGQHVCAIVNYGTTLRGPTGIDGTTPRYDITFTNAGANPFGAHTMPIPAGTPIPPGGDGHVAVADPINDMTYNLWQAAYDSVNDVWSASWGALSDLEADGTEPQNGSSTGSRLARFGCVVRESEFTAGVIDHALFFSTTAARPGEFRYPARSSDGSNSGAHTATLPEGARVQLDPTVNLDTIPGITEAEKTVGKALQTYGAFCGDNGGTRMAFMFEYLTDIAPYTAKGMTGDHFDMVSIPWDRLRVLRNWDGAAIPRRRLMVPF